jgi:Holliday junction DNA helicase RuvA
MIASLNGTVRAVEVGSVVLEVGGVGFRALCPPDTLAGLRVGQSAALHTTLVVREDSLTLFGFATPSERALFEMVQSASGIGPKIALSVVSVLPPADFVAAVRAENLAVLTKVPGIGRKGAQKLVIELKDKVLGLGVEPSGGATEPVSGFWQEQVLSGLESLGFSAHDANSAIEAVAEEVRANPSMGVAEILRAALQTLKRA